MATDNSEKIEELLQQINTNLQQPYYDADDDDDDEEAIDWQSYINKLWRGRRLIIMITLVFMMLGLSKALTMKRTYDCTVTLAPEKVGNRSSDLGGIASMLGVSRLASGNGDALGVSYYPDIVSSIPFLTKLLEIPVTDPTEDIDTTLVGYITGKPGFSILKSIGLSKDTPASSKDTVNVFQLTKRQNNIVNYLRKSIIAEVNGKTGEITITVTMNNPVVAATIADSVCTRLQAFIIDYRTKKAREDFAYYQKLADEAYAKYKQTTSAYAYYQDHNRGLILNAVISEGSRLQNEVTIATQVYMQMKQQAEMARTKVQEEKPIFAVIHPASVPLSPSNSRAKVLVIFTFFGFCLSLAWTLFGIDLWNKAKQMYLAAKNA